MFSKLLEHKITLAISIVAFLAVAGGSAYLLLSPQKRSLTNVAASIRTIEEKVSADGSVDSDRHVSLSFQKGGQVTAVNVKVGDSVKAGDVLARIDAGVLYASLLGAKADVQSAQANVSALQKGATSQTIAVYDQNVSTAKLALATAVRDAYLKIQDAVINKTSLLFQNGTSPNPVITIPTDSSVTGLSLNSSRVDMTARLANWDSLMGSSAIGDQTLAEASNDIAAAKAFINSLASAVNRLATSNSGMTQSAISAYVTAVSAAGTEVNAAETGFNSAVQAYKTATDQLNVVQASSTPEALDIAEAALAKAEANAASIQSAIDDTVLVSPFDGVVASVDPRVGESFPAGQGAIDVVSNGVYKIDIMVPENEVALISVGDEAEIDFDAGGSLVATGTVASIDLSETMVNGVGAYKTTVYLNGSDQRIRTGMSATVTINGISAEDVLAIPASAIIEKSDGSYALVWNKATGTYEERKIQTGLSDGNWTEVRSGIQAGELVAAFGQ